jgi:non-ribosomal peptide synthetase component E (peptide arylation enzyme)
MKTCADKGTIPKFGTPDRCIAAEEIPKTSVGKIDKKLIRVNHAG